MTLQSQPLDSSAVPHEVMNADVAARPVEWLEGRLARLAGHPLRWMVAIGLLATVGSATIALLVQFPQPRVNDEFSYLLAADTFAHGRLTNPPHPMWVHFESFHVIQRPTYTSKYQPAQGMMLAAGQVLTGRPVVGVWLSVGLMCAAIYWMLLAWFPPLWALLGGLLAVVQFGVLGYWAQSYWGGAVGAMGGALVFGGLRRVLAWVRARDAVVMALGLSILACNRPFEGAVASLPAAALIVAWMVGREGPPFAVSARRVVAPVLLILGVTSIMLGIYNARVTGSPFRLPYVVYEETYDPAPLFEWQSPRPEMTYRNQAFRDFYTRDFPAQHQRKRTLGGKLHSINLLREFYFGNLFTLLVVVMLPWTVRDRWMQFALLTCAVLLFALLNVTWLFIHYAAVATGLVLAVVIHSMRQLASWQWRGRAAGLMLLGIILLLSGASLIPRLQAQRVRPNSWSLQRARLLDELRRDRDRHLVIVRYGPQHSPDAEWVYNEADIDAAKVVWAREMEPDQNRALVRYFKDRRLWLLEADQVAPHLIPYPVETLAGSSG